MCSGKASMCGKGSGTESLAGNSHTREYAATASASMVAVRVSTTEDKSAFGSFRMPGSWLSTGMEGSAALRTVGTSTISGAQHHLAADPDHVAVDGGRAGVGVPGDGLGDVDRQSALGHGV